MLKASDAARGMANTSYSGTLDQLISFPHGEKLIAFLQPGKPEIREGDGHAIPIQEEDWFNKEMLAFFEEFN